MLVLLGPQRFEPTVRDAVQSLEVAGPVAVVTAGWQERESEDRELQDHLDREVIDLGLYRRAEQVLAADAELALAHHRRQERLRELQELYRLRLAHALAAARELMEREGGGRSLTEHRRAAIRAVRALDLWHLRRIRGLHEEFALRWRPSERPVVVAQRAELRRLIDPTGVVCIAGGHVAVLLSRMRLFDVPELAGKRPIIAWSAGAMAVCDRIVLYHDSPPQGRGNPEVLDAGLALGRGLIPLPHARRRLRLDDPVRVSLFARRFAPAICAVLDAGARLDWDGRSWRARAATFRLEPRGALRALEGA